MRKFNRKHNELRKISVQTNFNKYSEGSCLISFGDTKVICNATVEKKVPSWLKNSTKGWITAEYCMIPRATNLRTSREAKSGKQNGRSMEIQRLIGRSLRTVVDLNALQGIQIIIDCEVIQADGGTRTTSITGAFISLALAIENLIENNEIKNNPIKDFVSAVSCGFCKDRVLLDLDYDEDSSASTDANFVISKSSGIIEIQASGEQKPFSKHDFEEMYQLAIIGTNEIFKIQKKFINV